mmetsp:Transcript_804/g.616  ORF Transcript_804/g.616 Transcript_804/m.616 type:complete len:97 (+) Transcript_804:502-792(+)
MSASKAYRAHMMAISGLAIHPKKAILATVSDDTTWKIWSLPNGEWIMTGEGHTNWVAGVAFHPKGIHLATASGDHTVKFWDFANISKKPHTFSEHT